MWSDNDTAIDLLDFSYLIEGTKSIINNDALVPCTIGIYGDWGSGKSSLMRMVEADIEEDKTILSIKFNGWLFEGYDDAKSVLLTTIVQKIVENQKLTAKARDLAKKLFHQIDWMKLAKKASIHGLAYLATGGVGNAVLLAQEGMSISANENLDLEKIAGNLKLDNYEGVVDALEDSKKQEKLLIRGIRDFHKDLGKLIEESKYDKIVVFIDDLDRCTSDTIISTLEAIKLFLYAEGSIFIISAYEKLINHAVRKRFPEIPGNANEVGRDYLEKLIQFPVRIPQLNTIEIETYINLLFSKLYLKNDEDFLKILEGLKKTDVSNLYSRNLTHKNIYDYLSTPPPELNEALILSSQITPILTNGLNGNPRQCKRFLNMLLMRREMAKIKKIDLKITVLAKVMLLEYFRPEHFRSLSEFYIQTDTNSLPFKQFEKEFLEKSTEREEKEIDKLGGDAVISQFDSWLKDPWLFNWLKMEPSFGSLDLSIYFFFSRDNLRAQPVQAQRLSSDAQRIFMEIISGSKSKLDKALKEVSSISGGEAALLLTSLSDKIRQSEEASERNKLCAIQCKFCAVRKELISEYLEFLSHFPNTKISFSLIPQIEDLINSNSDYRSAWDSLLQTWSKDSNNTLAKTAKQYIK